MTTGNDNGGPERPKPNTGKAKAAKKKADMGKYNKTLHYNNQQSKLYWVEAPYNNFWCWLFWGTLHTTFKNVVVGLVLVGTKNYNFVK